MPQPTNPSQAERINQLEAQVRDLQSHIRFLTGTLQQRTPTQQVRLMRPLSPLGSNNTGDNTLARLVDVTDGETVDRTTQPTFRIYNVPGRPWGRGDHVRAVFRHKTKFYEIPIIPPSDIFFTNDGNIPGRVNNKPGKFSATRYIIDETDSLVPVNQNAHETELYNLSTEPVTGQKYIQAKMNSQGKWIVDYEACNE